MFKTAYMSRRLLPKWGLRCVAQRSGALLCAFCSNSTQVSRIKRHFSRVFALGASNMRVVASAITCRHLSASSWLVIAIGIMHHHRHIVLKSAAAPRQRNRLHLSLMFRQNHARMPHRTTIRLSNPGGRNRIRVTRRKAPTWFPGLRLRYRVVQREFGPVPKGTQVLRRTSTRDSGARSCKKCARAEAPPSLRQAQGRLRATVGSCRRTYAVGTTPTCTSPGASPEATFLNIDLRLIR